MTPCQHGLGYCIVNVGGCGHTMSEWSRLLPGHSLCGWVMSNHANRLSYRMVIVDGLHLGSVGYVVAWP